MILQGPWFNLPLGDATIQSVRDVWWLLQYWGSVREKFLAIGVEYWPQQSRTWWRGHGIALDETTLTVDIPEGESWVQEGMNPWSGEEVTAEEDPLAPGIWSVFIECNGPYDPQKVIFADITAWTNDGVLTITNIRDYITSGEIVLAESQSTEVFIVRRPTTDSLTLHWSDRVPPWPNAMEVARGLFTSAGNGTGVLAGLAAYITDTTQVFTKDQFFGTGDDAKEIMVWGDDGFMHRCAVVESNLLNPINPDDPLYHHTIMFDSDGTWNIAAAPVGTHTNYAVIKAGEIYRLDRERHQPWAWYRGAMTKITSHFPFYGTHAFIDQSLIPAEKVAWTSVDPDPPHDCIIQLFPGVGSAVDKDMWVDIEEQCSPPYNADTPKSPHIAKSFRYIQAMLEELCIGFVEKKDYTGEARIPNFTKATFYKAADIGLWLDTTVVSHDIVAGTITLDGDFASPYYPRKVDFAILVYEDDNDNIVYFGTATLIDGFTLSGVTFSEGGGTFDPSQDGKEIVVATGWRAFAHLRFRTAFDVPGFFVPDVDPDSGEVMDPAAVISWDDTAELGVGSWQTKNKSTTYFGESEDNEFKANQLAIYAGDNWNDAIEGGFGIDDPLIDYFDHNAEVHLPDEMMNRKMIGNLTGTATGGSVARLETDKDWYVDNWYDSLTGSTTYTGHVESGIATAGGTTFLEDNTKKSGLESGAFCTPGRFPGGSPYLTFPIKIQVDAVLDVWEERIVTVSDINATRVRFEWTEATSITANGKAWKIEEPQYHIHRWKGRVVRVTRKADGSVMEKLCLYSSRNTIWPETNWAHAIEDGDTFEIVQPIPGTVWQFKTAPPEDGRPYFKHAANKYWVAPRGEDIVRTGVPVPADFHIPQHENLPTIIERNRRFSRWDLVDYQEFYNQLYRGCNALGWTKITSGGWLDATDPNTRVSGSPGSSTWAGAQSGAAGSSPPGYLNAGSASHTNQAPFTKAFGQGTYFFNPSVGSWAALSFIAGLSRHMDAFKVTTPDFMGRDVQFYSFGEKQPYTPAGGDAGENLFDTSGDPVLEHAWSPWSTITVAAGTADVMSGILGGLGVPDWCNAPPAPDHTPTGFETSTTSRQAGYRVTRAFAIVKWNMTYA